MYGGEARLAVALLGAVPDYLRPRVGLADGKFSAFVAARTAAALGAVKVPPDVEAFLAPHSVDLLPIANGVKEAMHRFDLHTLGDVASWRVRLLVDQFGGDGRLAWELARGVDRRPLVAMKHEESVTECLAMPPASASLEMLMAAVDRLLQRTFTRPDVRGPVRGLDGASVQHRRRGLVGEDGPLQTQRRAMGGGCRHPAGSARQRPSHVAGGGVDPHPRRSFRRVGGADGAAA